MSKEQLIKNQLSLEKIYTHTYITKNIQKSIYNDIGVYLTGIVGEFDLIKNNWFCFTNGRNLELEPVVEYLEKAFEIKANIIKEKFFNNTCYSKNYKLGTMLKFVLKQNELQNILTILKMRNY